MKVLILSLALLTGCAGDQVLLAKPKTELGHPPKPQQVINPEEQGLVFSIVPWVVWISLLGGAIYLFWRTENHK